VWRRQPATAQQSAPIPDNKGRKGWKRWIIMGPYTPHGLFQTKGETCANFASDRFGNVDLYDCNSLVTSFPPDEVPKCRRMNTAQVPAYRTHFRECNTLGLGTRKCRPQGRDFL
jgi:hypothetical protein